ncbi:MAG: DUF2130 domain-containing protein [Bacilli bacterium]|jgi:hypothetical protein|nr:DUF2130 domain-containing protein [Bacilli bacterium]
MAKLKDVSVISPTVLRLNSPAQAGDEIDLKDLQQVDLSYIDNLIKSGQDKAYNEKFASLQREWKLTSEAEKKDINSQAQLQIQSLKQQIDALNEKISVEKEKAILETKNEYNPQIVQLKNDLQRALDEKKAAEEQAALKQKSADQEMIQDIKEQLMNEKMNNIQAIKEKDDEINALRLNKASTGVKTLGEQLETWCNNEYQNYAVTGFENCTWEKDNTLVAFEGEDGKGTKADYIFRVYSSDEHTQENELASVCMDMKNENPESKTKKKNADYYKKLDSDRTKKNCEYALLVSELEMDKFNDAPIVKVTDYPKMYMVRPPYFIAFLSIIESLGKKYKDLLEKVNKDKLDFKEAQEIIDEFEQMKSAYLDKPLVAMESQLQDILDSSKKIADANQKINDTANKLINQTLENIRTKIARFDINKLAKKIDNI